jgi:phosphoglucosamine mutase
MARHYFGTDGIRGRVGQGVINPEFVLRLGWAAGRVLGRVAGSKVLIGKDTRISGYMFESALEAGLSAAGVDVRLLGPMPTPGVAYLTRALRAQGGIVISASHNPHWDNGIKFFAQDGAKLPDAVEEAIERQLAEPMSTVESEKLGKAQRVEDAAGRYIEFCKGSVPPTLGFRGLTIVVDCAHGAAYHIAPRVLEELGARVIPIGVEPDGLNINAEVGSTCPDTVRRAVVEQGADLGIALDGDGDRVIMVDHKGNLRDGDDLLYVIAVARGRKGGLRGAVVGTHMSNLGLEQALRRKGMGFERAAVGDRYVMERLQSLGGTLGGEPSGHIICLDRTTTGDGIIAALQVLSEIQETGGSLDTLCNGLEKYPQRLVNVRVTAAGRGLMDSPRLSRAVAEAEAELGDRGRVLLRPSGTEPLVRVMVEGSDSTQVARLSEHLAGVVGELANGVGV